MIETILGGALGAVARLAPEVLNFLDKKNERAHELALGDQQMRVAELQQKGMLAQADMHLMQAQFTSAMEAMKTGIAAQAQPSGVRWIDGWAAAVRPGVTTWVFLLYALYKTVSILMVIEAGGTLAEKVAAMWTPQDDAMLSSILVFWFVGRVWERVQPRVLS